MAAFDLQRLCRNVIHSISVSIQSLPKVLQNYFQYECCCSNNLSLAWDNDHLKCAKAANPSKRMIRENFILAHAVRDGKIEWLKWSRENGDLWSFEAQLMLDDCTDPECLEYARQNGGYEAPEDSDDDSSEESEESEESDEDSLSWFTESDDDESDAVLDTDEEWSDDDKDDVDKLINVIRSKLPEVDENEREDELKIVKVCVEYFDTKESLFKYLKKIM